MTPPSYEAPGSKVLKGHLKIPQTFSSVDNPMKAGRLCAFGPYRLDFERRLLMRGGELVALYEKALEILIVLVRHRGEVVSKDELMKAVWPDAFVEEANLSQNVFVLRKALGERAKENRYIATIPGRGYSFVASLEEIEKYPMSSATTIDFVCRFCGKSKGDAKDWLLGFEGREQKGTVMKDTISLLGKWDEKRANEPNAVHFCSTECEYKYTSLPRLLLEPSDFAP
jgi:DNA-binding winged helix-turn-helix (wHTH) protein